MSKRTRELAIRQRMLERRPASVDVEEFPPGRAPGLFTPGDFSLHRATTNHGRNGATTTLGKLIQAGERARYGNSDYARWTHSTLIVSVTGDICEAEAAGVERNNMRKYLNTDYKIVHVAALDEQRTLACRFAEERVGDKYGVLNFVGLAVQSLFGLNLSVHMDGHYICSGLVSRATEKYIDAYPRSSEDMMPGDLACYWRAESGEPKPPLGFLGRLLNLLVAISDVVFHHHGDPAADPGHGSGDPPA